MTPTEREKLRQLRGQVCELELEKEILRMAAQPLDGDPALLLPEAPVVCFDRRDDLQDAFVRELTGSLDASPLRHYVPSSEGFADAVCAGLGWGLVPHSQAEPRLRGGALVRFLPDRTVEVPLYWQQWRMDSPALTAVADAVAAEAARALREAAGQRAHQNLMAQAPDCRSRRRRSLNPPAGERRRRPARPSPAGHRTSTAERTRTVRAPTRQTARPLLPALAALLAAAALAGCVPEGANAPRPAAAPPTASTAPADRPELRPFYKQQLAWSSCGEQLQCATLTVPMDYAAPQNGKTFTLPLAKATATDPVHRKGSLVFGTGGPGGSGVQHLKSGGADSFGKQTRARFDLVGFDPRGVAGSTPAVDCTPPDTPAGGGQDSPAPLHPGTEAERRAALADADRAAAECKARSAELLPHVGTLDGARDLDVLRAALGDEKLTYLGWSYSTYPGTVYAEQFPERVRALVLDGVVDPAQDWTQQVLTGGRAFRRAVEDYADRCPQVVQQGCPAATPDGIRQLIADLYARTARHPLPAGDHDRLDETTLHTALTMSMYTPESQWQPLSEGLSAAAKGDGSKLAAIAKESAGVQDPGPDSDSDTDSGSGSDSDSGTPAAEPRDNSADVLTAVNCLDVPHPADPQAYWDLLDRTHRDSGTYGDSLLLAELTCRTWPKGPTTPHRVSATHLPPVLVVGTTLDPATPYENSQSLAGQFPGGMLLTLEGPGHTAYGRGNTCITEAVDHYLVDLAPVPAGTTC
ncbi:alpha/beta fold hydrolase [Kitasatospora sp. NPDC002227]|uniref:alpha/beta fold hydrolase n=1 Tax=Kitasatospora sp. NPDC002227 TaxID=3154773 RepID=UPI003329DC95